MIAMTRIAVGAFGLLMLLIGAQFWFDLDAALQTAGLEAGALAGRAIVRADVAGFFLTAGAIALYAAIRARGSCLWPVLVLLAITFVGRALTIFLDGFDPDSLRPMMIEAGAIALILLARRSWSREGAG